MLLSDNFFTIQRLRLPHVPHSFLFRQYSFLHWLTLAHSLSVNTLLILCFFLLQITYLRNFYSVHFSIRYILLSHTTYSWVFMNMFDPGHSYVSPLLRKTNSFWFHPFDAPINCHSSFLVAVEIFSIFIFKDLR